MTDRINPPHYRTRSVECIELAEKLTFCAGNALKYIWRAGDKPGVTASEDWSKAAWYLRRCERNREPRTQAHMQAVERARRAFYDDPMKRDAIDAMAFNYGVSASWCEQVAYELRGSERADVACSHPVSVPEDDCNEPAKGDECVG